MKFDALVHGIKKRAERSAWQRCLMAFVFGMVGALALPPTNLFPLFCLSFPAYVILLRDAPSLLKAFAVGWSFAFGLFLLGLYWTAAAMFVDIATFWWAVPLAAAGLPAALATFYAIAASLSWRLGLRGTAEALTSALLWFLADYARGHLFTGFPWNLEGYGWSGFLPVMQFTSVAGIYGLTLLTLIVSFLPAAISDENRSGKRLFIAGLAVFAVLAGWGMWRLQTVDPSTDTRLRIVQPNINQAEKWSAEGGDAHFTELLDLSSAEAPVAPRIIFWPETASTFYLEEDAAHRRMLAARLSEGSYLLTGVIRRNLGADGHVHYANALVAVDRTGRLAAAYDKFHLVPFGEYIPFRKFIPIRTLANLGVDFTAGKGLQTLKLDELPTFSPLICYEAIFPGEVARRDERPDFLVNITNDGWYGRTAGPYQHFASARARAIEEGLPLVRSANTGISAVIDPHGRSTAKINLSAKGFVDAYLPHALPPTIFSRYGEKPLWAMFAGFLLLGLGLRHRAKVTQR